MKIHTDKTKPHRKWISIAQVITVSLSLIKSSVTIVYIMEELECIREQFESTNWI